MSNKNKISTKFDTSRTENEECFKTKLDEFKAKAYISIDMKFFCCQFKQISFLLLQTFIWSHQLDTSQVTRFSFPCITIHQTSIIRDPRRQHPYSNSKMVVCHSLYLLSIFVNKQELDNIQITQRKIIASLNFSSHQTIILNMPQQKKILKHSQE